MRDHLRRGHCFQAVSYTHLDVYKRQVWAWGDNQKGQLGNGSRTSSDVPVTVTVPAGVTFVKVNSGGYSCYAIDGSGRLWAWGGNDNGQLGTRSGTHIETKPVDVGVHLTEVSSTASNVAGFEKN